MLVISHGTKKKKLLKRYILTIKNHWVSNERTSAAVQFVVCGVFQSDN